jgi:hypothetical protein
VTITATVPSRASATAPAAMSAGPRSESRAPAVADMNQPCLRVVAGSAVDVLNPVGRAAVTAL